MATSAWNQGAPVPSTTWPFLIRMSACCGLSASTLAAPARRKRAKAAGPEILLRRVVILFPFLRLVVRHCAQFVWERPLFATPLFVAALTCCAALEKHASERQTP